ncbi:hypothetical protein [Fructobacillus tropaeoli]|uniref:hypothetical protein n=1 Tax=Fructobacillus tropaeoli TaxID=709323 RepID=UPI002D87CA4D|nr:unnamed protein product [Fructobacillus tropaeoli]
MLKPKGWHPIHQTKQKWQETNRQIQQRAQADLRGIQENPKQKSVVSMNVFWFILAGFLSLLVLSLLAHL